MKKVLLSVAVVAAFGLASCGGPDLCECMKQGADMSDECKELSKEQEKKYEEASDEEKEEMLKEAEKIMKDCKPDEKDGKDAE